MVFKVKLERIARDIKSYEFAQMLKCNPNIWSQIESGNRIPPPNIAEKASEILGMSVERLFTPVITEGPDG